MRLVVVLAVLCGVVRVAAAQTASLDKPSFTATPQELLAAAKTKPAGTEDAFILREEVQTTFDDAGRSKFRAHRIFVITAQAGVDDWGWISVVWNPTYQDKPTIRARVIAPGGAVTELDASQVTEKPMPDSVRRQLDAKFPGATVGSIVEQEIVTLDREAMLGGGDVEVAVPSSEVPIVSARSTFEAPAKRKLHLVTHGGVGKPQRETRNGIQRVIYSATNVPAVSSYERSLPLDDSNYASIAASVADSWASVVRAYRAELDKRMGPVSYPANVAKTPTVETASALLAWLQSTIRRDSRFLRESTLLPVSPADVVKAGAGEDKDRAALLIALLDQAGIKAELAFLSTNVDADPELVSLDAFDHVIVRATIGGKAVWIDPSERSARVGQLVENVQDRHALVIAPSTTGLVMTPTSSARDNVSREVRTYDLQEQGPSKVTEVSTVTGAFEPGDRDWARNTAPDQLRKHLQEYVDDRYVEAQLDDVRFTADDLSKPFEMTLVMSKSQRGFAKRDGIDVYLFPSDALVRLPNELGSPSKDATVRKHDFALRPLYTQVIENRIVVPTGFDMPAPAPEKTRMLGGLELVETQRRDGNVLIVTWRLEIPKSRWSPSEVTAIQTAVRALRNEPAEHLVFDQIAYALVAKGKNRDALAEAQRLIKLHPKEALHQIHLSSVLLRSGAGEAARRAAKKATELEPKNADAFSMYGWVLSHDTFGQWHGFDFDRAGALAAFEKARSLDPKHVGAARQLATLLQRNAKGKLYGNANELTRSLAAWRDAHALDPEDPDIADALVKILLFKGDIADAETIARSMPAADMRNSLLVAAVAAGKGGPESALSLVSSLASGDGRTKLIQQAGAQLMFARRYDEMRAMYAAAPVGGMFDTMIKSLRRVDSSKLGNDPEDVARAVMIAIARDEYIAPTFADKKLADELRGVSTKLLSRMGFDDKFPVAVIEDMLLAVTRMDTKRENGLARVDCDQGGIKSQMYMVVGKGGTRFIATTSTAKSIGRYLLTASDEKASATLLDWFIEDHRRVDAKMSAGLKNFWAPNLPRSKPAIEVVAAVLAGESDPKAIAALKRCNTTVTTSAAQYACDYVLAVAYRTQASWSELEDHAHEWSARSKQMTKPLLFEVEALAHLGKFDDAEKLLGEALKADPDDHGLLITQIELAWGHHQAAVADQRSDALVARADASAHDLNATAWLKLVEGADIPGARKLSDRGLQLDNKQPNLLNTAAAIEAEQGDLAAARGHVEDGRDVFETPTFGDYYVHGRILEQLGFADDAVASYRKIKAPKFPPLMPDSFELAQKRLAALGVKK